MAIKSALLERFLTRQKTGSPSFFEVDEIVDLIAYFYEKEDMAHLDEAVDLGKALYPDDSEIKVMLCKTLAWEEEYERALELLDTFHLQGNKNADILRVELYFNLGKSDEAFKLIDELTATNCDYLDEIYIEAACTMNEIKELLETAYQFIQKGITLFPENESLHSELCLNIYIRGYHNRALEMCRQFTIDFPDSIEIWYLLSQLYYDCADYENAVNAIEYALSIAIAEESNGAIYELTFMKARYLFKCQSYIMAVSAFREISSSDEYEAAKVNPMLAECFMFLANFERAYEALNAIYGHDDIEDKLAFYGKYIYCCIYTNRRSEAIDTLCEALKEYPDGILSYLSMLNFKIVHQTDSEYIDETTLGTGEVISDFFTDTAYYHYN